MHYSTLFIQTVYKSIQLKWIFLYRYALINRCNLNQFIHNPKKDDIFENNVEMVYICK